MKIFNRKAGNRIININGTNVKFVNCVAEVDDEFGKEALKLGLPNLFEFGKQPVFETPKEIQMKSDFNDREEWYKKELARVMNVNASQKKKIVELEQEVLNWKAEYGKEHELRIKFVSEMSSEPETVDDYDPEKIEGDELDPKYSEASTKAQSLTPEEEEELLRSEFSKMKKDDLIAFGKESGFDMSVVADKTKAEIIDFLVESSK